MVHNKEHVRLKSINRVMFVLNPLAIGGMETLCLYLADEYRRRGIQVGVVIPESDYLDPLADMFSNCDVAVTRLDTDPRSGRWVQFLHLSKLAINLHKWHPDVVHLHTGAYGGVGVAVVTRILSNATVVVTEHDIPVPRPPIYDRIGRYLLDRLVHALVSVSRRNAGLRRRRLRNVTSRTATVLNGTPLRVVTSAESLENRTRIRRELGIGDQTVVIGSLVRLAPGKGLHDLIQAFARLKQRDCRLVIVGDGELRDELQDLVRRLDICASVHIPGFHPDPAPFLDAFDVFVLAVPSGSMSIALLEAMDRGLPPVITFGGPEEAVIPEVTGLVAPPSDPAGLAQALQRLVDDPALRRRLGAAAAEHVRCHYSIGRVADDLLELYAGARAGRIPARLRSDGPPDPFPGRRRSQQAASLTAQTADTHANAMGPLD